MVCTQYTIDGDPIPETVTFNGRLIVVTRDTRLDRFAGQHDRRTWTWTCRTMTQRASTNDPGRFSCELGECGGEGVATGFL